MLTRMGGPILDRANPIPAVLHSGESLIWMGKPKGGGLAVPSLPARQLVVIAVGLGLILEMLVDHWAGPLPALAKVELFAAGALLMAPLYWLGREARNTTYAVTNQRLLMSVGPDRAQIRELTLAELGPAVIYHHRDYGRVLSFGKRGPRNATSVWTFLDGGKADKWFDPWCVDDPEAVRQLIETASNNYWFSSREH
jgi:hypothetical protein